MSHRFGVDVIDSNGVMHVRVSGEVDMTCAPELLGALVSVNVPPGGDLILDLSQVEFMDSAGVSALIEAQRTRETEGIVITIVGSPPPVLQVFRISGVDAYLDVLAPGGDRGEAIG